MSNAIATTNLEARYDGAKSFYGKAKVRRIGDSLTLISYTTSVMRLDGDGNLTRAASQPQSMTTARHMREFALQHGFGKMSKGQLLELPTFN